MDSSLGLTDTSSMGDFCFRADYREARRALAALVLGFLAFFAICSAQTGPLNSVSEKDVDGDTKPDRLTYVVKEADAQHYQASLTIRSAVGQLLWDHEWTITRHDFIDDLLMQEADVSSPGRSLSVEDWVTHFFDGSLNYGAVLEQKKLQESDLDDEQVSFAAKQLQATASKVKQEILSQTVNIVFSYRAEWREDLIRLVYLPTIHKFVAFARGY